MAPPRHHIRSNWCKVDFVPLLCIMMALIGFMALTTLAVGTESHQQTNTRTAVVVQLASVPDQFMPLQVRCRAKEIGWLDGGGQWRSFPTMGLLSAVQLGDGRLPGKATPGPAALQATAFMDFLKARAKENQRLSYQKKQYTIILWVEPTGVDTAALVEAVVDHLDLPLRIGKLPALEKERINEVPAP